MKIKIKKLHLDAVIPQYAKPGDSGFDLVAVEEVSIAPGEIAAIPTGLAFEIPEGYELQIRPRSGVSWKTKLRIANSPGTVDSSYRGEVKVLVENTAIRTAYAEDSLFGIDGKVIFSIGEGAPVPTYVICKGDRVAQGIIVPVIHAEFEEVNKLSDTERGVGGFGSTGIASGR